MHLNFIQSLLSADYFSLRTQLAIVIIMWLLVAIAITIDLVSGVRKAKERGEMRTSFGFKQTVNKVVLYYAFMLFSFMFDCIGMFFYSLPFVTFIGAAFLIFIEWKSLLEKAHDKDKRKFDRSLQDLTTLLADRDDIAKALITLLKKQVEECKQKEDEDKINP